MKKFTEKVVYNTPYTGKIPDIFWTKQRYFFKCIAQKIPEWQ